MDHRGRNDLAVQDDREPLADVVGRRFPKAGGALAIEAEVDDRLSGLSVEALRSLRQHLPGYDGALLQKERPLILARQDHRTRRNASLQGFGDRDGVVHHLEGQLGGLADDGLQSLRIALAGSLHDDLVKSLPLDGGLTGAQGVDPPADDLDGLVDRPACFRVESLRRPAHPDALIGLGRELQPAAACGDIAAEPGPQQVEGLVRPGGVGDADGHVGTDLAEVREGDILGPQCGADILDKVGRLLHAKRAGIHGELEVGSALEVQAQVQGLLWQEGRKLLPHARGQQVGQREQHAEDQGGDDGDQPPARGSEHASRPRPWRR